jgi:hypothetical protein
VGGGELMCQAGRDYLLFLQGRPWPKVCANGTLAEVMAGSVSPAVSGTVPLWSGASIENVSNEIRAATTAAPP